jgi:hypothetical protein
MRVLLDTNILVRLRDADSPLHSLCVEAIERLINQMAQICLCLKVLIPIAEPEFTNSCAYRIPPLPALSPLVKGGEGRGEGGFESCAFTNFGSAVGIIPIVRPKFIICPPPLGSPRFARGTARGAPVRFPLQAGGTLRREFSFIRTFVNSGSTIGIIEFWSVSTRPREANGMGLF